MPGISGLDLIREARILVPGLPAVLTSGFLSGANYEEARRLGVDVVVPKPCTISDLVAAVRGVLPRC